jgi:hypothetical protein
MVLMLASAFCAPGFRPAREKSRTVCALAGLTGFEFLKSMETQIKPADIRSKQNQPFRNPSAPE